MSEQAKIISGIEDEDTAELVALTSAVNESLTNPRAVPHDEMKAWLLEIAAGNFDAPPPVARLL